MRVKRNTKKIIRRKGSKKNLKKYVGGGPMFENGKLTDEAKQHLGVVMALAIAGASATALNAVIINKFPGTHAIMGNIIYSFARLIPVSLLESASAGTELAFHFCDKVSYIIKGMLSIIWKCRVFISGAIAIPVVKRIKEVADSIIGTDIDEIAITKATELVEDANYNNFYNTTFNLLVWVIENTYQSFENVVELCLNRSSPVNADNVLSEIGASDTCETGGKVESEEIKTAIDAIIADDTNKQAKDVIDINLDYIRENRIKELKNRISVLKAQLKTDPDETKMDVDNADEKEELETLQKELVNYNNLPETYPFGITNEPIIFDFTPSNGSKNLKRSISDSSDSSNASNEDENIIKLSRTGSKTKIEGGKKNTQKRRSNVSRKHRK